ncbi:hypothetical protein N7532_007207 [Penicillium argentinense]|uniref:Rhodopsin domain-containing protein n=1 Tax=Penicillium argentinense TaxID=1131581 RepID=A0A9W9F7E7_9EURO|nr:uncharacterized protein N7532_007207 [Penicillium argentinense]KAJ5094916.1 hypothetical protein N7532_007207 [Penicillium argentinense]
MADDHGPSIRNVDLTLASVASVAVALRCYVRLKLVKSFGWDDTIMVLALLFQISLAVSASYGTFYGIGRKLADINAEDMKTAKLCWWLGQIFYILSCCATKISVCIFLLRVTVSKAHFRILYTVMGLTGVISFVFLMIMMVQCQPISYFWDRVGQIGKCLDPEVASSFLYVFSVTSAICDFTVGLLPASLVWNLQMNKYAKITVATLMGMGCIASTAVVVRIPFIQEYKRQEFLYETANLAIWSNVESGLGITAGSLATLRPLFRFLRNRSASCDSTSGTNPLHRGLSGHPSSTAPGVFSSGRLGNNKHMSNCHRTDNVGVPNHSRSVIADGLGIITTVQGNWWRKSNEGRNYRTKSYGGSTSAEDLNPKETVYGSDCKRINSANEGNAIYQTHELTMLDEYVPV